ncbi:MAG: PAS domain-containing protein, partial [Caldilinea sp.]|nr:PAS domain-containing protein [Caldilinea sp.]
MAVPVASIDASRRLRLVNESFCRLLGRRVEDVLGRSIATFDDSEFGNALGSIPIEYVLAESEPRNLTFY